MKKSARQLQKEQTRETLLSAAYDVFSRQGITKTRMEDVAKEANVSHGTVFAHFKTQEALVEAVVGFYGRQMALETHLKAAEGAGLSAVLGAHLQGIAAHEAFYTRLVQESGQLPQGAKESFAGIQAAVSLHFSMALDKEGVTQRLHLPAHLLFGIWTGLVHHYLMNADSYAPGGGVILKHGDMLKASFLYLINR